jgi:lipoate-protein ligase A
MEGRRNIAIGQALIEQHVDGALPDTLRFLRFPPTALVGRHQALQEEVDVDYCQAHGIGLVRRITGGGAIYLDPGQLGWELVISRATLGVQDLTGLARKICEAAAAGLVRLGIEAAFRPRNDIEVDGRKIGGTGGFFDGDTLFYQGTVLVDMDPEVMIGALRVPRAKLEKRDLDSAAQRVVTLKQLLGEACPSLTEIQDALVAGFAAGLDLDPVASSLDNATEDLAQQLFDEEIGLDSFVNEISAPAAARGMLQGEHHSAGGTIRTYLRLEGPAQNRIGSVLITGDFFVTPPRVIYDLEGHLRGTFIDGLDNKLDCFFGQADIDTLSVGKEEFLGSLQAAIDARVVA